MKEQFNKYGKKLSEREYLEAVVATYSETPSEKERRKKETNLMIDHYIGVDYPQDKRGIFHATRERATIKFTTLPVTVLKSFLEAAAQKAGIIKGVPDFDGESLDLATKIMAKEFAKEKALDADDIAQFLGKDVGTLIKKIRGQQL